jgi:hypothetical protein
MRRRSRGRGKAPTPEATPSRAATAGDVAYRGPLHAGTPVPTRRNESVVTTDSLIMRPARKGHPPYIGPLPTVRLLCGHLGCPARLDLLTPPPPELTDPEREYRCHKCGHPHRLDGPHLFDLWHWAVDHGTRGRAVPVSAADPVIARMAAHLRAEIAAVTPSA